jgi:uncharacterized protein involved in response to NO
MSSHAPVHSLATTLVNLKASQPIPFRRMCEAEPFRIFFPLGLIACLFGLALWPLHLHCVMAMYPGLMHARIMVEGFLASFIIGFLGTAGPRLLNAPHFTPGELTGLVTLQLATLGAHLAGRLILGDACFFILLATFVAVLGRRFARRTELPPPNFVLVGLGLLTGLAGAGIIASAGALADYPRLYTFGALALTQGLVLLPVLGVGGFLFPRFLSVPFGAELAEMRKPTPLWKRRAALAAAAGVGILVSFAVESAGFLRVSGAVRFAAATAYIVFQMPVVLKVTRAPLLGQCLRLSVWLLLLGLLWPVFLPAYRVAGLHLVFIGGFMLTTLAVSTRVILGHSGQLSLCKRPLPVLFAMALLLLIALVARVAADFMPSVAARNSHLGWAACLCLVGALVLAIRLLPRVFSPDTEE